MVLGFGKPSRKYATTQTSNYHPDTGYPVGQDESRIRREREERQRQYREEEQQGRSRGGYGYRQDSSSDDDGGAYQRRGEHVNGVNGRSGNRVKTIDHAFPPSSSSQQQRASASNLQSTPFPTFRPKSSSSASALAVQSQVGKTGGKPKKVKKKTDVEKQFQAFSVLDLAPPAPGSTATATAGGGSNGAERKKTKKKKVVPVFALFTVHILPPVTGSSTGHHFITPRDARDRSNLVDLALDFRNVRPIVVRLGPRLIPTAASGTLQGRFHSGRSCPCCSGRHHWSCRTAPGRAARSYPSMISHPGDRPFFNTMGPRRSSIITPLH